MFDCSVFIWFFLFGNIYIYCVCTEDEGVKVEGELRPPSTLTHFDPVMQI